MNNENYVWYFAYGSNISHERFSYYIAGGKLLGIFNYEGCEDKTPPINSKTYSITKELYFAKHSPKWNGGVAFIKCSENKSTKTFGKLYLITKEQFRDIAKQETATETKITLQFEEAIDNGYSIFKSPSWYGKLLFLGNEDNYPIFTITNENDNQTIAKPSPDYLYTIATGLKETHHFSPLEIIDYFIDKQGIKKNYKSYELYDIVEKNAQSPIYKEIKKLFDDWSKKFQETPEGIEKEKMRFEMKQMADWFYGKINIEDLD